VGHDVVPGYGRLNIAVGLACGDVHVILKLHPEHCCPLRLLHWVPRSLGEAWSGNASIFLAEKSLVSEPCVLRTHLPIWVRPLLADQRHLPPEKTKHPNPTPADASQNICAPFPRSLGPHDTMRPFLPGLLYIMTLTVLVLTVLLLTVYDLPVRQPCLTGKVLSAFVLTALLTVIVLDIAVGIL